jgi:hypothetical protein
MNATSPWFRCAGCQCFKHTRACVMIPWYRHLTGPQTTEMGFCRKCANKRRRGETGRALSHRLIP